MRARRGRVCVPVHMFPVLIACHECLENLQEIFEEIDVHQMREFGYTAQRRREERRRPWIFQDAEVEHEEQLERLRVLHQTEV